MGATGKAYKGTAMEGRIARWYAANTGRSIDEFVTLSREVSATLSPASHVLEVAPGPGYFAVELAKRGSYEITGLDISRTFVEIARQNARTAGVAVDFRIGNASDMPFPGETFDFLLCRAAFKNFSDPVGAVQEMKRVLKSGGSGRIIDMRKDATSAAIANEVNGMGLSWIGRMLTRSVLRSLRKRAYMEQEFRSFFARAGIQKLDIRSNAIGFDIRFTP